VTGVVLLNFGEPEQATPDQVIPFLERIFTTNASLEGDPSPEQIRARSRELAERRAPGLIAEYEAIGGSPLNAQARIQAQRLEGELRERGIEARVLVACQFTDPTIPDAVAAARAAGFTRLIGLPVYPLCGHSTTVASLRDLQTAVSALDWDVDYREISGWHGHDLYLRLRADGVLATAAAAGVDLNSGARLVFSAHGTPLKYLQDGNRYDHYVQDCCRRVARLAGVGDYTIGFQNHSNRPVEWTQPDIEQVVDTIDVSDIVVVPISFMHEQSETLAELDHELRGRAEARGLGFHRVPVPHDDPRFAEVLADLVESRLADEGPLEMFPCRCRPAACTRCLNGAQFAADSVIAP
jgi:ferrochelatase